MPVLAGMEIVMYGLETIQAMNAKVAREEQQARWAHLRVGDKLVNGYGEEQVIVGESTNKYWWIVESVEHGVVSLIAKDANLPVYGIEV